MSDFDNLMHTARQGRAELTPDWGQGRATFGGLLAAMAHEAMRAELVDQRPLRSLAISFVGPAAPDQTVDVSAEILRQGKAVTQVESRIHQDGETVMVALGSFGSGRDSEVSVEQQSAPEADKPDAARPMPQIEGVTPDFLRHYDLRFCLGGFPFTGSADRTMGGWMRFREAPACITHSHLVALVDTWPPAVLPHLSKPAPASTLSWTMELVHPMPSIDPSDWLLYQATIDQARDGYGLTRAGIWTASGELVARSQQTVTVFA
ncbi:thioesterase family protein [Salicola sp. Rm-C-2C1-2]|uniref:acyl-CoA thioesterase n=1 Tax=Salicola sp. Rm-C-2C1-2 TaxID=3141321 RepID=UPI0032E48AC9